jgi:hypothetical protein
MLAEGLAMGAELSATGRAALEYAVEHGLAVFPVHTPVAGGRCSCSTPECDSIGKHPRTVNGFKDATRDPDQIADSWGRHPDANIGIPTGATNQLAVLDSDSHLVAPDIDRLIGVVKTPSVITGRGDHRYFKDTPPGLVGTTLMPAVDLKARDGYVVAPPSLHRSGQRYMWRVGAGLADIELAPMPEAILEMVASRRASGRGSGTGVAARDVAAFPITDGKRHTRLTQFAGRLLGMGATHAETLVAVLGLNEENCKPPMGRADVRAIVDSIARREAAKPGRKRTQPSHDVRPICWPHEPGPEAFHGLAGDVVATLDPHTESDRLAVLAQLLVGAGAMIGRGAYFEVEGDRHHVNLNILLVGSTASGRKGSSWGQTRRVLKAADPIFVKDHIASGLSSGEGLIHAVRDERRGPSKARGEAGQEVVLDPGVTDKRLLVYESEFAVPLKRMALDGNSLSGLIRQAWDGGDLGTMVKNAPDRATEPHIAVVAHTTAEELRRRLDPTEASNGFLNRFMIIAARRSKYLPDGGNLSQQEIERLGAELRQAVAASRHQGLIVRDTEARDYWHALYPSLVDGTPGKLNGATSRGVAQVSRVACLYALLDRSSQIGIAHMRAAVALWRYAVASAEYVFAPNVVSPVAEKVLAAVRGVPGGLTRTQVNRALSGHVKSPEIDTALGELELAGRICRTVAGAGNRSVEFINYVTLSDDADSADSADSERETAQLDEPSGVNPHNPHNPHEDGLANTGSELTEVGTDDGRGYLETV